MVPLLFTSDEFFTSLALVLITGITASFFISIFIYPALLLLTAVRENTRYNIVLTVLVSAFSVDFFDLK